MEMKGSVVQMINSHRRSLFHYRMEPQRSKKHVELYQALLGSDYPEVKNILELIKLALTVSSSIAIVESHQN